MTPFKDTALALWNAGLSPIPLGRPSSGSMGKMPKEKKWQNFCKVRASEAALNTWIKECHDCNIGLAMGLEVWNEYQIVAVDIDLDEYRDKVERAIGALVCGKRGQKGATWFALASKEFKSKSYNVSKVGRMVDFLADGRQTVVPTSIHPETQQPYVWLGMPLTDPDFEFGILPILNAGFFIELQEISNGKDACFNGGLVGRDGDEIEIDGINNMIWAGVGGGGTTHENRLKCSGHMVATGWTDEDAVARLDRAMREAWNRNEGGGNEPDWNSVHHEHVKMVEGARSKGFDQKPERPKKAKGPPPERVLADWASDSLQNIVHVQGQFRVYRDGHWPVFRAEKFKKAMLELDKSIKYADVSNAEKVLATLHDNPEFGESSDVVCLQNGTLDIGTMQLLKHDPGHEALHQLNFEWDPTSECPTYDKFIQWVFCDDQVAVDCWDEFCGLTLIDCVKYQKMLYLIGNGSNGKSTLSMLLMAVHSDDAVSTVPITSLDDERHRTSMVGALLNISSEQSRLNTVADDQFKKIVAGDPVSIRLLFKEVQNKVRLKARLLGLANELPAMNDTSHAMRRRMMILQCGNTISDEDKDPDLIDKLLMERPAILRRWVEALKRLNSRGRFQEPQSSIDAVSAYLRENDSVAQWIESKTFRATDADAAKWPGIEECYIEYQEYAKMMGYRSPYTIPVFKAKLKNLDVKISRTVFENGNVSNIIEQVGIGFSNSQARNTAARI